MFKKSPIFDFIYPLFTLIITIYDAYLIFTFSVSQEKLAIVATVLWVLGFITNIIAMSFYVACLLIETKGEYGYEETLFKAYRNLNVSRVLGFLFIFVSIFFAVNGK